MGLHMGFSRSSACNCGPTRPNPDPKKYEILNELSLRGFLLLTVLYPDANNFEGKKLLLYDAGTKVSSIRKQGSIDPHFSDNPDYISPIARFEPTSRGLNAAVALMRVL